MSLKRRIVERCTMLLVSGSLLTVAGAHAIEPTTRSPDLSAPWVVRGGLSRHPAPTFGLNAARDGQSPFALPSTITVAFRVNLPSGGVDGVAVSAEGIVAISPNAELIELGLDGQHRFTRALAGIATSEIMITADGTRVVASRDGWLEGFDAHGAARFRVRPGWNQPEQRVALLPLRDGSWASASVRQLHWLESDGTTRASTTAPETIIELYAEPDTVLALGRTGTVFRWDGRQPPQTLGDFQGESLRSLPLIHNGLLLAVTQSALRGKDVKSGELQSWVSRLEQDAPIPISLGEAGEVTWVSEDNLLVRAAKNGRVRRLALGPQTTSSPFAIAPLHDAEGRIALVNALGELVLIDEAGKLTHDQEPRCARPLSLLPLGPGQLLLTCTSGTLWALGQGKRG